VTINVTNISPAPGAPIALGGTLSLDVTWSPAPATAHNVLISYDGATEVAFDGTGFVVPYASSARVAIPGGWRYTLRRSGSWPKTPAVIVRDLGIGLRLMPVAIVSGETPPVDSICVVDDDGNPSPEIELPHPSEWPGGQIIIKRIAQPAAELQVKAPSGVQIDSTTSYSLIGPDACAEFYSDGVNVLVGPTTTYVPEEWTPADEPDVYIWAEFSNPARRTMTGNRLDVLANPAGVALTRSAGTPIIDTTKVRNGLNPMVMDATTLLGFASGGPVGNAAHCIIILTDGSDATAFTGFCRAGAIGGSGGLGLTTSGRYAAGLVAGEGSPNVASPEPLADGELRMLHCQHRPNYGLLTVGIDGRAPIAASGSAWAFSKTLSLDGSFYFGAIESGRAPNTSPIWEAVAVHGTPSAGFLARLAAYWTKKFSLPKLAPMLHVFGDSLADPGPISPATTNWPSVMKTTLDAQLTVDGRATTDMLNSALSGKMLNGVVWASGSPNICRQADGLYPTAVLVGVQGMHYSAPYSRSGRRRYDLAIGGAATNDIINAARTDTQIIEDLKYVFDRFINQSRYDGIVWHTIPAGSTASGYFDGARGTYRTAVNSWLVNSAKSGGFLRDIDEVVDLDAAGLIWNTTYYGVGPDTLHQNDTGKALMAAAMYEAVYRLIRKLDP
jgi:hypothetical protein